MQKANMNEKSKSYKPGFFCVFFWAVSWLGMLTGIAALFVTLENAGAVTVWSWSIAAAAAVISYIIRTVEKSSFEGHWSWHWFD